MAKLKVPSLQHLARNWFDTPEKIENKLINLTKNPPYFSYKILFKLVYEKLHHGTSDEQLIECIKRKEPREQYQKDFINILKLVNKHFSQVNPKFVMVIESKKYSIGRDLNVPFTPPLIYGDHTPKIHFPWFSFWKSNPLSGEQLSLFVTIVDEIMSQDPELEKATFNILDFSVPKGSNERILRVIDARREIPILEDKRKIEMLKIFAEGYERAKLSTSKQPRVPERIDTDIADQNQLTMIFDE